MHRSPFKAFSTGRPEFLPRTEKELLESSFAPSCVERSPPEFISHNNVHLRRHAEPLEKKKHVFDISNPKETIIYDIEFALERRWR